MKADSSPKKLALTSSKLSLVPPNFVLRGGTALVSSYSSFFSQTLNGNTNQTYANGVKLELMSAFAGIADIVSVLLWAM